MPFPAHSGTLILGGLSVLWVPLGALGCLGVPWGTLGYLGVSLVGARPTHPQQLALGSKKCTFVRCSLILRFSNLGILYRLDLQIKTSLAA